MERAGTSEDAKKSAYADLSECEKYMLTMINVSDASKKFDCMLFKVQFRPRFEEIVNAVKVVEKACEEVRSSEKLRQVMAMILTLVNEINTGGDGTAAFGFSLDALLKLNEVSASGMLVHSSLPIAVFTNVIPQKHLSLGEGFRSKNQRPPLFGQTRYV